MPLRRLQPTRRCKRTRTSSPSRQVLASNLQCQLEADEEGQLLAVGLLGMQGLGQTLSLVAGVQASLSRESVYFWTSPT